MKIHTPHKTADKTIQKILLALSISIFATSAAASIALGDNANDKLVLTGESSAFIAGSDEAPHLQQVFLRSKVVKSLKLPKSTLLYDYGYWGADNAVQAVALTATGVYLVSEKEPQLLVAAQSLYSTMNVDKFKHHAFTVDSNNDGLTDIFLPGFSQQTLYQQQLDGSFVKHEINHLPIIKAQASKDSLSVNFELPNSPDFIDINGDNTLDAVFTSAEGVTYFSSDNLDNNSGNNSGYQQKQQLTLPIKLADKESELIERLTKLSDFNHDGVVDLFTASTKYREEMSLDDMDENSTMKVYLGNRVEGLLSFDAKPISEITLEGMSKVIDFPNLTGDSHSELAIVELDIGFTDFISIASAAISGDAVEFDAEIRIHRGIEKYQFSEGAEIEKDFEFSSKMVEGSENLNPSVNIKDFNGDGKNDLLLRTDDNVLKIFYGEEKRLLSRKAKKIKHDLPESNNDILTQDINQDGKEDILIKLKDKKGLYSLKIIES